MTGMFTTAATAARATCDGAHMGTAAHACSNFEEGTRRWQHTFRPHSRFFWLVATDQIPSHAGLAHLARDCRDQLPSHACLAQSPLARPCRDRQPSHACLAQLALARDLDEPWPSPAEISQPCVLGSTSPGHAQTWVSLPSQAKAHKSHYTLARHLG